MKIGFSFGRCVGSIVRGEVALDDVMCIIARTHMETAEQVTGVIDQYLYMPGYLDGLDENKCHEVGLELFKSGRILEPRAHGIRPMQVPRDYVWMDLFPTVPDVTNAGLQSAWEHYRMMLELAEQVPEPGFVPGQYKQAQTLSAEELEELKKAADILANAI